MAALTMKKIGSYPFANISGHYFTILRRKAKKSFFFREGKKAYHPIGPYKQIAIQKL